VQHKRKRLPAGTMYVQQPDAVDDAATVLQLLRRAGFGHLVSTDESARLTAAGLPFLADDDMTRVRAHIARANDHWRHLESVAVTLIVPVSDADVSPIWDPSKVADPRVVPTRNDEVAHLHGTVHGHDDPAFIDRQVPAIVGVELVVCRLEAKRKLSQNPAESDERE